MFPSAPAKHCRMTVVTKQNPLRSLSLSFRRNDLREMPFHIRSIACCLSRIFAVFFLKFQTSLKESCVESLVKDPRSAFDQTEAEAIPLAIAEAGDAHDADSVASTPHSLSTIPDSARNAFRCSIRPPHSVSLSISLNESCTRVPGAEDVSRYSRSSARQHDSKSFARAQLICTLSNWKVNKCFKALSSDIKLSTTTASLCTSTRRHC